MQGIPQLRDCFNELRVLTSVMLDKELPMLLLPENAAARRRKYPILSLEKVGNILEKYQGTGLVSYVARMCITGHRIKVVCLIFTFSFMSNLVLQGDKLMGGGGRNLDILFLDKKEVQHLVKIVRQQGFI